jgi:uncharacterized protein YkwD
MPLVLSRVSQNILYFVNENRSKKHIHKLQSDLILMKAALFHSRDMAKNHYCDHINGKGENPTDRVNKLGFNLNIGRFCGVAENCGCDCLTGRGLEPGYLASTERGVALGFIEQWRKSPPHWENIMNPDYNLTGIGVASNGKMYYSTQVFYG